MLFPTFTFAVFFAVVLAGHWTLCGRRTPHRLFLLAASYLFYGWWDWRFLGLIGLVTLVNQICAWAVHLHRDDRRLVRTWTAGAIGADLVLLGFFKYYDFFAQSLGDALGSVGAPTPPLLHIVLPVGISFFTFQAMSYVIDVQRDEQRPAALIDFALYLAFFPQLVAGPIVRASEFLPQLRRVAERRNDIQLSRAAVLIAVGLFKKTVVSSYVASQIVDPVFASPERHSAFETLLGVYGYAVQIYADFSGYTDIAIGIALLMGFEFPQNFNRPYAATSIQDFWRRWHMTLSNWLRDYLYIGLGGNRRGRDRRELNLLATMVLGGLWHGAAWTFVVWGFIHGGGLAVERRLTEHYGRSLSPWFGRFVTFHFVCLGWVFFRAPTLSGAFDVLGRFGSGWTAPSPAVTAVLVALVALALATQLVPSTATRPLLARLETLPVGALAVGFGAVLMLVDVFGPEGVAPFIYFQF